MTTAERIAKLEQMLHNRCTPEIISELKENDVFVFGSKPDGNHRSGAAKIAVEKFGANKDWVKVFVDRVMLFLSINIIHIRWTKP